jgi:hypothetical protein
VCEFYEAASKEAAGAPEHEIEVTPEMIEAGVSILASFHPEYDLVEEMTKEIYVAMRRVARA